MPGADDKVILRIKLETQGVSKDLAKLTAEMKALRAIMEGTTKTGLTGFAAQNKAIKTGTESLKEQARLDREIQKQKSSSYREDTKQYDNEKKRNRENLDNARKTEGVLRRFFRGVGVGSGADRMFQRPEGGYSQRMGQLLGSAPRVLANTAMSIGGGLLGFMLGGAQSAYGTYLQVGQAKAPLAGMGLSGRGSHRELMRSLKASGGAGGVNLGYGPAATYQQAAGVGRATGEINAVYRAQQFAMAGGGMDVGEATGIMGGLRSAGLKFGKGEQKESAKELGRLIAAGLATGIERPRLGAYLQNIAGTAGEVGLRTPGNVDLKNITGAYGMVAQMGINDPGRARAMVSGLDRMIQAPGAGEAGQALTMQAFGFGRPGGETSYYDALKRQDRGFTGKGGTKNLMDMIGEVNKQYGVAGAGGKGPASEEANLVLKDISGMTLDNIEAIQDLINSGKSQEEIMKKVEEIQNEGLPIEKQALAASKQGFSDVAKRIAGLEARNAGVGAKVAGAVEKVQDWQFKLLDFLVTKMFPVIEKGMKFLEQMVGGFKLVWDKFGVGAAKVEEDQRKEARSTAAHQAMVSHRKKWDRTFPLSPEMEQEKAAEYARIREEQENALRGLGPGSGSTESGVEKAWEVGKRVYGAAYDPKSLAGLQGGAAISAGEWLFSHKKARQVAGAVATPPLETQKFLSTGGLAGMAVRGAMEGRAEQEIESENERRYKRQQEIEAERLKMGEAERRKALTGAPGPWKVTAEEEARIKRDEEAKKRNAEEERKRNSLGPVTTIMLYDPSDAKRLLGGFYTQGQPGGVTSGGSPTGLG